MTRADDFQKKSTYINKPPNPWRISVAPMMDWTDRHCRYFHRLLSRHARLYTEMLTTGAVIFGVSRDNMKSHDAFKAKLLLPFELIADTEEKMCHMFGVVKNKIMYGKKVKGIERSTFLVGPDGQLKQEWRGLKVPGHVDEVLKAVKLLKKAA